MPSSSRSWLLLLDKEWRELMASRSWWILLIAIGPLVGVSFIGAAQTYAEASGLNGTSAGVGEAFSPLLGVLAPSFGACELAAAFLLPFVCIRLVAGDRQSGALKLEMQHSMPTFARVAAKAVVLLIGWAIVLGAPLLATLLWRGYGGALFLPELLALVLGQLLNAGLTIGLAAGSAALAEHPSTAAILTLGVTVGTWVLSFVAAVHGGIWERAAAYTPAAMTADFQHGLVRLDSSLVALALIGFGLGFAAIWLRLGSSRRRRTGESLALAAVTSIAVLACTRLDRSFDLSEDRANSFFEADEAALRTIVAPLRLEVHLAPEDPRRFDLERHALKKLRRAVGRLEVRYVSATSIGLFEQTSPHYGELDYELDGRRATSRSTTEEGVLESVYAVAGMASPPESGAQAFRGHPLAAPPVGAAWLFYGAWPAVVASVAFLSARRSS